MKKITYTTKSDRLRAAGREAAYAIAHITVAFATLILIAFAVGFVLSDFSPSPAEEVLEGERDERGGLLPEQTILLPALYIPGTPA